MKNLIPLEYLNEACFLSLNNDDKKYQMCLKMAQERLRNDLGKSFYDQIESQYPNSLSADNSTLYEDYIKNYLAWLTYQDYLKFAQSDSTPSGIREFSDENSELVSDIKLYSLEKNVKERFNFYRYEMINFIKNAQANDSSKYPLFDAKCNYGFNFGITAINKKSDTLFKANKSIITNE